MPMASYVDESASRLSAADPGDVQLKLLFSELQEEVFKRRPVLRRLLNERGDVSLHAYASGYAKTEVAGDLDNRQAEFIGAFRDRVKNLLGEQVADRAARQLQKSYYVSTADHHGPICHPFFLNSNLVAAAPHVGRVDTASTVIVLSNSNVSLNNSSYPRGLLFTSMATGTPKTVFLPLFPASERLCPVFGFRPFAENDVKKVKKIIQTGIQDNSVEQGVGEKVLGVIDDVLLHPDVLGSKTYSDQITRLNFTLWRKFFHGRSAPDLVYLELESLVLDLLTKFHLDRTTLIHQYLFDPAVRASVIREFDGILGSFTTSDKSGTFMFWALAPGQKYRQRLWVSGEYLVTDDGTYRVELTPTSIREAITRGELIPSTMLSYAIVALYYGVKCLGGFSQINYLTFMKDAFLRVAGSVADASSVSVAQKVVTDSMCGDFTVAVMATEEGMHVSMTGLDLIVYGDEQTWDRLLQNISTLSIRDSLIPMMPEFYNIIYPQLERRAEFAVITSADVATIISGGKMVEPCVAL